MIYFISFLNRLLLQLFTELLHFFLFHLSNFISFLIFANSKILVSPVPHRVEIKLLYFINIHYKISLRHNICSCEERICYVQFSNAKKIDIKGL